MTTHLLIHAFIYSRCVNWVPVWARQSTIYLGCTVNKRDMVHLLVEIIVCWEKQRINEKNECWGRSSRRHDWELTDKLGPGNWRLLTSSPVLGMYVLPTVGADFKDTVWGNNVLLNHLDGISDWNQLKPLCKLRILAGGCRDLFILWCPRQASYVSTLAY